MTCSAAEFDWTEIIQVVPCQYGETQTDEQETPMDWTIKVNYLKRNPVTVAGQIYCVFKKLRGKVILNGIHPIGQILNFDSQREFQNRGTEHIHAPIHVVDAQKDSEVVEFTAKYTTCALTDETKYPEMSNL